MGQNEEICKLAIETNWRSIKYVALKLITLELYLFALEKNPNLLHDIMENAFDGWIGVGFRNENVIKLFEIAMRHNGLDLDIYLFIDREGSVN